MAREVICSDPRGKLGAVGMACFGGLAAFRFRQTGMLFYLLLCFRDWLACVFLFRRSPSLVSASGVGALFSYFSACIPLFYFGSHSASSAALNFATSFSVIAGFLISTLATVELGTRMGVSPAFRENLCTSGIYRRLNHPMYVGYAVSEFSWMIVSGSNAILFLASISCYVLRAQMERDCIGNAMRGTRCKTSLSWTRDGLNERGP